MSLVYKYDADIKTMVNGYMKKIPENKTYFDVTDMEVINFIYNGKGDPSNLIKYSGELKKYINYKNFSIDVRRGEDDKFFTEATGIASFIYNNTFYGILSGERGAYAKHIIYVPDSTGDTKEELMQAAQKRIDDYIGKNKVTLSYVGTGIYDLYMDDLETELEEAQRNLTEVTNLLATVVEGTPEWATAELDRIRYEDEVSSKQRYIESFEQEWQNSSDYDFLKEAEGDFYFNAKVFAGTENETDYYFVNANNEQEYNDFVNNAKKASLYDTGVTAEYGDQLLTLSTCEYSQEDGRFVVVCKKIGDV